MNDPHENSLGGPRCRAVPQALESNQGGTRSRTLPELTFEEWSARGVELFGKNSFEWRMVCPACGHVQTGNDFLRTGMDYEKACQYIGFSCIGRFDEKPNDAWSGKQPCNYAGGGLFKLNPQPIRMPDGVVVRAFAFEQ